MLDNFRFETFVDVHSNIFAEYLSSVIAKLPKYQINNKQDKIEISILLCNFGIRSTSQC